MTIDARTKGGTLDSGTSYKEKISPDPKPLGMDKGSGTGLADQKVPHRKDHAIGDGQKLRY